MKKKQNREQSKNLPMRTCCGCRQSFPKKELIRIVRKPDGTAAVDITGKANGRGTYICKSVSCLEKAVKTGSIARSLEISVSQEIYEELKAELIKNEA